MTTTPSTLPPKQPPPRSAPPAQAAAPKAAPAPAPLGGKKEFKLGRIKEHEAQRVLIYGTGGCGKSSLACLSAHYLKKIAYFDLENTLPKLKHRLEEWGVEERILAVDGTDSWPDLLSALQSNLLDECDGIVIDSLTRAEEWAIAHTLKTVPASEGKFVNRLELYGYGKGFSHVYETFLQLFSELNRHYLAGRSIILICHNITAEAPAVQTERYMRWEPRLLHQLREKHSIRMKAKEWVDEMAFIGYDVTVRDNGTAVGSGSRTIQTTEQPFCMAKSRSLGMPLLFEEGSSNYWIKLFPNR